MLFRYVLIFLATLPAVLSSSKGKNKVVKESIRLLAGLDPTTTLAFIGFTQPDGTFASVPTVPGTLFIANGSVVGNGDNPTYYYILQCTVLEGVIFDSPPGLKVDKQKCELDVCVSSVFLTF